MRDHSTRQSTRHGRQRTRRSKLRGVGIPVYFPLILYALQAKSPRVPNIFPAEAISHPLNPTSPAWAKSPTLHPVGQGKPKKALVPQGTPPSSTLLPRRNLSSEKKLMPDSRIARQPKTSPATSQLWAALSKASATHPSLRK